MFKYIFFIKILTFLTLGILLNSCEALKYKKTKAGEVPVNAKDRVKKNIEIRENHILHNSEIWL